MTEVAACNLKESQALFLFPVMSAAVHVKHVQLHLCEWDVCKHAWQHVVPICHVHTCCGASCHVQLTNKIEIQALSPDDEVPGPPVKDFMSLGHRALLDR